jgi:hypothetical protein
LLAKKLRAQLYTTDYNLSKVAAVEGIDVLNVNELAQSLRPITLPGETLNIKIIQKGSNRDQGVGYLEDGTMIVVDGGARHVGKSMPVIVTRMHQTVAGKMVFGQIKEHKSQEQTQKVELPDNSRHQQKHSQRNQEQSQQPQPKQALHNRLHGRLNRAMGRRRPNVNG